MRMISDLVMDIVFNGIEKDKPPVVCRACFIENYCNHTGICLNCIKATDFIKDEELI